MKNKKNKSNININGYAAMIFFIIVIVILLIIGGNIIRNSFNCKGDMFSYSGAVIGGGLTLIGVIITMLYQEIKRVENLSIQYKPFIDMKLNLDKVHLSDQNDRINIYNVIATNVGHGELYNFDIIIYKCNKYFEYESIYPVHIGDNILAKDKAFEFYFSIDLSPDEIKKIMNNEKINIRLKFLIIGKNLIDQEIQQTIEFNYMCSNINNSFEIKRTTILRFF